MAKSQHQWTYQHQGAFAFDPIGPMPEAKLVRLAKSGEIKKSTLVASPTRTKNKWVEAKDFAPLAKIINEVSLNSKKEASDSVHVSIVESSGDVAPPLPSPKVNTNGDPAILSASREAIVMLACVASLFGVVMSGVPAFLFLQEGSLGWPLLMCSILLLASASLLVWSWLSKLQHDAALKRQKDREQHEQFEAFQSYVEQTIRLFKDNPEDESLQHELLNCAMKHLGFSEAIYTAALVAVEDTEGSNKSKQFAVKAGRLHYGGGRHDGSPTTYDEAAIRNDISARTGEM